MSPSGRFASSIVMGRAVRRSRKGRMAGAQGRESYKYGARLGEDCTRLTSVPSRWMHYYTWK